MSDHESLALRLAIHSSLQELGRDELRVVERIVDRLAMGRQQYGELNVGADSRDWDNELREEILDTAIYSAIALESHNAKR